MRTITIRDTHEDPDLPGLDPDLVLRGRHGGGQDRDHLGDDQGRQEIVDRGIIPLHLLLHHVEADMIDFIYFNFYG